MNELQSLVLIVFLPSIARPPPKALRAKHMCQQDCTSLEIGGLAFIMTLI